MRRIAALLLAISAATADDLGDTLARAERLLGADDPAARAEGARLLDRVADADPQRLTALLDHPDPEVAESIAAALTNRGIFRDPADTARCRGLLEKITGLEPRAEERLKLLTELLDMGTPAAAVVAAELAEADVEALPPPAISRTESLTLRARNRGRHALWFDPGLVYSWTSMQPFGLDRAPHFAGGRFMSRFGCGGDPNPDPREMVLKYLNGYRRVPAGAEFDAATVALGPRLGLATVHTNRLRTNRRHYESDFGGRLIANAPSPVDFDTESTVAVLRETRGPAFDLSPARTDDGGWALDVTVLRDRTIFLKIEVDPFWWVAEGADGALLGSGPMGLWEDRDCEWRQGEVRRIPMEAAVPAGTRRLWFGFDVSFDETRPEQYVAAPVAIEAAK